VSTPMRIGILMTDGLGDVVCASGIVTDLRRAWPDAYICVIVRTTAAAALFRGENRIDDFIHYDPVEGNTPGRVLTLVAAIRRRRFDTFIVVTDIDRHKAPCLALASGASRRVGEAASRLGRGLYTHWVPRNARQHKVRSNQQIVSLLGIEASAPPHVTIDPADAHAVERLLLRAGVAPNESFVTLHPGSGDGESHKRWSPDRFRDLIAAIGHTGMRSVLVGAGGEVPICERLARECAPNAISFAGQLPIGQTAAVLRRSVAAIGADSGVMHLAAAVGSPTICLFGPTDDRRTSPFAARAIITTDVECRPCYPRLPRGCGRPICMSGITVTRVMAELAQMVASRTDVSTPDGVVSTSRA
jgi:ADP-heptose:LPS heptosyltransferase